MSIIECDILVNNTYRLFRTDLLSAITVILEDGVKFDAHTTKAPSLRVWLHISLAVEMYVIENLVFQFADILVDST